MYEGKCSKKGWNWKKVQDRLLPFQEQDCIGTIYCSLETNSELGFSLDERAAIENKYIVVDSKNNKVVFMWRGQPNKAENISAYESYLVFLKTQIKSADKAVLGVKKSSNQLHLVKC